MMWSAKSIGFAGGWILGGRANCCEVAAASGLDSWRSDGAAGMSGFVTVFSLACFRGRVVHRREHESV